MKLATVFPLFLYLLVAVADAEPLFLFSGQINMEGHSSDTKSVGANADFQHFLYNHFLENLDQEHLEMKLHETYATHELIRNSSVVEHQANLLMELHEQGLFDKHIAANHSYAKCFWNQNNITKNSPVPISPFANCGESYGHELMFATTLSSKNPSWRGVPFTVAKVAHGGTEIYNH